MAYPAWSADGSTLVFEVYDRETGASDLYAWHGTGDPVNLTGTDRAWPPLDGPVARNESRPSGLPDGRVVFVQAGNVWAMPAQAGAQKVLLADLPYSVRNADARGA